MKQIRDKLIQKEINMKEKILNIAMLFAVVAVLVLPSNSMALGTTAGLTIANSATLTYQVGGVNQTDIISSPDGLTPAGVTTDFLVDNVVQFALATVDTAGVQGAAGQTNVPLTFTLTNNGNFEQDFLLSPNQPATGQPTAFASGLDGLDDFNVSAILYYQEDDTTPGFQVAQDTAVTFIDELGADVTTTIYLVSTLDGAATTGQEATLHLIAQALVGGAAGQGIVAVNDAGIDDTNAVQIVLNDAASASTNAYGGDGAKDGLHSSDSDYVIASAFLDVAKTAVTVWDPVNWIANPKAIPGALVEYEITITNSSASTASATLTQITDAVVAAMLPDVDLDAPAAAAGLAPESGAAVGFKIVYGGDAVARRGASEYTTNDGTQGTTMAGQNITIVFATLLPAADDAAYTVNGEIMPNESVSIIFRAYLQ